MKRAIVFVMALLAACSSPVSIDTGPDVESFHKKLDAGDFAAIWKDTSSDMREATTEEDMNKLFSAVNRKLGKVVESKQIGWRNNVTTNGTFAEVQMETKFENGKGMESFVFRKQEESLKLAGYHINSNDLLVN